jgi:hypothetical protein
MRHFLLAALLLGACDRDPQNPNGNGTGTDLDMLAPADDLSFDRDAFYIDDPPPTFCALDGGMFPPPPLPGGTRECPDDKNRIGCPCPAEGMQAPCWPGARKNRNLGICKDGVTTCMRVAEVQLAWGPCVGYQLPQPGATSGPNACECFSQGQWKLDNLSPCFIDSGGGLGSAGAVSTVIDPGGVAQCPPGGNQPVEPWTPNTLTVDCAGHFKLCYTLKAGDVKNPQPSDCTLTTVCTEADYTMANMLQTLPVLPSWKSNDTACATQFAATGGYGEMTVNGVTIMCDKLDKVFNRVGYCPLLCNDPANRSLPQCQNCTQGGSGSF